ncbi:hypothetical protein JG688_00015666, partial [Phytophthora aleatoria]
TGHTLSGRVLLPTFGRWVACKIATFATRQLATSSWVAWSLGHHRIVPSLRYYHRILKIQGTCLCWTAPRKCFLL